MTVARFNSFNSNLRSENTGWVSSASNDCRVKPIMRIGSTGNDAKRNALKRIEYSSFTGPSIYTPLPYTRERASYSLLQIYGLIVAVVIELGAPYFVGALVIALTEADGCPETDIEIAQVFQSVNQRLGIGLWTRALEPFE